ncbi:MAG: fumarate hydratase class I [Candidatus Krumholzibacteriia bacterium]|jgi:fumarate hydratase class I
MLLEAPFTEKKIRALKVGDRVDISGLIFTGRDAVHKYLHDGGKSPVDLKDSIIYHCGPVVVKEKGKWVVKAAGPTTSIREEPYQGPLMERFGIRAVIGKGGMGPKTLAYCKKVGAVYFHAVGGAAQVLAECVVSVEGVHLAEKFGAPEAIWELQVKNFPVVVTMDSHGNSLHEQVLSSSVERLNDIL